MAEERIAVIGAGSWGTALAKLVSDKGLPVNLWAHRREHVEAIGRDRENKQYLAGYPLADCLTVTHDLAEAVRHCQVILMVVPSHGYREVFSELVPHLANGAIVVSATKGIENETLMTMTQVMEDVLPEGSGCHLGVLSGPSFAKEVAAGIPTAVTAAAYTQSEAKRIQSVFSNDRFRVYASVDVIGLELGGALKNIIAIAAGICDGLGYGTNTRAGLITRGLAEISRLGVKMGANPLTFSGLGGLGDLVLTCTGDLSRNRHVGLELGKGKKLKEILDAMGMVAEGVKTTKSSYNLARREGVEMPILEQVYQVLYQDKPCKDAVHDLLSRNLKGELE